MSKSLKVSRQAYGKIFLHVAKYFDCPILGYVVGHESDGQTTISDVLPVCHSNPAGPVMEISGDVVGSLRLFESCCFMLIDLHVLVFRLTPCSVSPTKSSEYILPAIG